MKSACADSVRLYEDYSMFQWVGRKIALAKASRAANRASARAEMAALTAFRTLHPDERVMWTSVISEEEGRYVVGVYYRNYRPPDCIFYAVKKIAYSAQVLEDDAAYRPHWW